MCWRNMIWPQYGGGNICTLHGFLVEASYLAFLEWECFFDDIAAGGR